MDDLEFEKRLIESLPKVLRNPVVVESVISILEEQIGDIITVREFLDNNIER